MDYHKLKSKPTGQCKEQVTNRRITGRVEEKAKDTTENDSSKNCEEEESLW